MARSVSFYDFEEARLSAGFFVPVVIELLGVSERSWYRWKQNGRVPLWAMRLLEAHSGRLDHLGLKHWSVKDGKLLHDYLDDRYHHWDFGELLASECFGQNSR